MSCRCLHHPCSCTVPSRGWGLSDAMQAVVLDSLDAEDGDAFFRRIGRAFRGLARGVGRVARGIGRGIGRVARGVGRGLATVGRVVGRGLVAALPIVSRVVGFLGPVGRLVSAGLGAVHGLASGQGWRGALAGAVGNLVPGVGGRIASSLIGGNRFEEDAELDALADMADAGEVDGSVAEPIAAGLATRRIVRTRLPAVDSLPAARRRRLYRRFARAEAALLDAARDLSGTVADRIRLLRTVARLVAVAARRRPLTVLVRVLPTLVRRATARVAPRLPAVPPGRAQRRHHRRQAIVEQVRRSGRIAAA